MTEPLLSIRNLTTHFVTDDGIVEAVDGVGFDVHPGETVGVVGESGSGKSVTVMSLMGLVPSPPARVVDGEVLFEGRDLLRLSNHDLRRIRGKDVSMVFQDPMTSLNPVLTVGFQLTEMIQSHNKRMSRRDATKRAIDLLDVVGIPQPDQRVSQYPHEFSGGMRQRAMIAMAIANDPKVLIADEPTTALDVTIQAQVLEALQAAQRATNAAIILITHDLGLVAEMADRVVVMYCGRVVEQAPVQEIFDNPRHPYTLGLMASVPRLDVVRDRLVPIQGLPANPVNRPAGCAFHPRCFLAKSRTRCSDEIPDLRAAGSGHVSACHYFDEIDEKTVRAVDDPDAAEDSYDSGGLEGARSRAEVRDRVSTSRSSSDGEILRVEDLKTHFDVRKGLLRRKVGSIRAVDGVSFSIRPGETLGLVGESGCGKSTTGRTLLRLLDPTDGRIYFKGRDITTLTRREMRSVRREMQIIFQDPFASLNPRFTVRQILESPLRIHGIGTSAAERGARVSELLELVGLEPSHGRRFPHEFSGGQRQRIGIARALAVDPELLILDEPVSSLDVSIQAQILNLLQNLQEQLGLAYLFIAHDLSVVRHICTQVGVMYLGRIVEIGDRNEVYNHPTHPYTQALLSAVPIRNPSLRGKRSRIVLEGDLPSPGSPPSGCNFRTRCFKADARCAEEDPLLDDRFGHGHPSACHYAEPGDIFGQRQREPA